MEKEVDGRRGCVELMVFCSIDIEEEVVDGRRVGVGLMACCSIVEEKEVHSRRRFVGLVVGGDILSQNCKPLIKEVLPK